MNTVKIRSLEFGADMPKVIIPIVEADARAIFNQAREFKYRPTDCVEWRADYYANVRNTMDVLATAKKLRKILGDIPLIFTFRTKGQGGMSDLTPNEYHALNLAIAASGLADAIDLEIDSDAGHVAELTAAAHAHNVVVIGSRNYPDSMPSHEEFVNCLRMIQTLPVDITKIAAMTHSPEEAIRLMAATEEMNRLYADRPIIALGMGRSGVITRIAGEITGSCATYGAVGAASAPGQFPVERLQGTIKLLHNGMKIQLH